MYGGITISSTNKKKIKVPATAKKTVTAHKRPQNVTETLKKLKKMQTGMTISKTVVPMPKAIRRCKAERKFYGEDATNDDTNGNGNNDNTDSRDFSNDDDDFYDPAFDVKAVLDDDSDSIHSVDDDDDDDYNPSGKKSKAKNKLNTASNSAKQSTNTANTNPADASSKLKAIKINTPPVFLCTKCKQHFSTLADLKHHVFQKNNSCTKTQLTCKICSKVFETRKRLNAHAKVHEEKVKFICDKCGKIYTNQVRLHSVSLWFGSSKLERCDWIGCRLPFVFCFVAFSSTSKPINRLSMVNI